MNEKLKKYIDTIGENRIADILAMEEARTAGIEMYSRLGEKVKEYNFDQDGYIDQVRKEISVLSEADVPETIAKEFVKAALHVIIMIEMFAEDDLREIENEEKECYKNYNTGMWN